MKGEVKFRAENRSKQLCQDNSIICNKLNALPLCGYFWIYLRERKIQNILWEKIVWKKIYLWSVEVYSQDDVVLTWVGRISVYCLTTDHFLVRKKPLFFLQLCQIHL